MALRCGTTALLIAGEENLRLFPALSKTSHHQPTTLTNFLEPPGKGPLQSLRVAHLPGIGLFFAFLILPGCCDDRVLQNVIHWCQRVCTSFFHPGPVLQARRSAGNPRQIILYSVVPDLTLGRPITAIDLLATVC